MENAKLGSIFVLIGGILSIVGGVFLAGFIGFISMFGFISEEPGSAGVALIMVLIALFAFVLMTALGVVKIIASRKMKNPKELKKWSIIALVLGIVGGTDIVTIIGAILGLTEAK